MARRKACDCCHSKKIHCDNTVPQCNWCKHHGLACTYKRFSKRAATRGTKNCLAQGLDPSVSSSSVGAAPSPGPDTLDPCARGSDRSTDTTPPLQSITPTGQPLFPRPAFGEMHFAGYQLGEISSYCGIPLFSVHGREWIKARAGEDVGSNNFCLVEAPKKSRQFTPSMLRAFRLSGENLDLPPRPVVASCFEAFRASHFKLVFPIVDLVLFPNTIDVAYEEQDDEPSLETITSKACIFAFLAVIASARIEFRALTPEIDADACAFKVQHLLPYVHRETNVTALQTFLMLTVYHLFKGQMEAALKSHTLACRMTYILGGHLSPVQGVHRLSADERHEHTWRVKTHLRKVFWLCYTFDKDMALRTGHPPCIEDEHCDLSLPPLYLDRVHRIEEFDQSQIDDAEVPWLPGDLRLSLIKSKTYRILYSADALRKSDADLVRDIRGLDEDLERWRISVPAHARPQLFYSQEQQIDLNMSRPQIMHFTVLHFEYHYLMATIHRAVGRCHAWTGGEGGEVNGLGSSLSLSVEASRATIFYLRLAIHFLFQDAFWFVVLYPMSAVLTIFGNIMMHPLQPRAKEDLQLLNLAPELLKQMQSHRCTPDDISNMASIERFMTELTRLGSHAIAKAEAAKDFAQA